MARARVRIIVALLLVLPGTAQAIASVCESFCPAHARAAVAAAPHHGSHHAAAATDEAAAPQGTRLAMPPGACCATPDTPGPMLTTIRVQSLREGIAASSGALPAFAPNRAGVPVTIDAGPPSTPSSRARATLILRI